MRSTATATVRLTGSSPVTLHPGDLVGRLGSAALRVDDPRVSEAHALVSLRVGQLHLLALRGVLGVDGQRVAEVALIPGLKVRLARDLHLEVMEVVLPDEALALAIDDSEPQLLIGAAASLLLEPDPGLSHRFEPEAAAQLWSDGVGWRMRVGDAVHELVPGAVHTVDGHRVRVEQVPLWAAGQESTVQAGALHPPLRIVAHYDTVHLHRKGHAPVLLSGIQARIVSELVALGGPAPWETVAGEIWRDEGTRHHLRRRWDVNLNRLRSKLEQHRIRPDLVHSDGTGRVELVLHPQDEVEDNT